AFGSGAAFALEDGWILARAVEYTRGSTHGLRDALGIFDEIRSPYYSRMNDIVRVWEQWVAQHSQQALLVNHGGAREQESGALDDIRTAMAEVSATA
ncbi:hypothetical protein LTR95_019672, partial [Oleoguttula sp. CCFEE 5521]